MKIYSILTSSLFILSVYNIAFADDVTDLISRSEDSGAQFAHEASGLIDGFRKYAAQQSGAADKMVDSLNNRNGSIYGNGRGVSQNQGLSPSGSKALPRARKYPKQEALKDIPLPHNGKGSCKDKASQGSGKCPSSLFEGMEEKRSSRPHTNTQLLIFVSQSVPGNSLKELWNQAQRVGGKLVFRGLVKGSFKETQSHIQELGIVADIDPAKFEEFGVTQVPAFVLSKEGKYDKMVGNISLGGFLDQCSTGGDLKEEAASLYKKFQEGGQ